jgi:hypothetical protein
MKSVVSLLSVEVTLAQGRAKLLHGGAYRAL